MHGSVTAEFVVNGGEKGVFALAEERMVRDQEARSKRLEEQEQMKRGVLEMKKEAEVA